MIEKDMQVIRPRFLTTSNSKILSPPEQPHSIVYVADPSLTLRFGPLATGVFVAGGTLGGESCEYEIYRRSMEDQRFLTFHSPPSLSPALSCSMGVHMTMSKPSNGLHLFLRT